MSIRGTIKTIAALGILIIVCFLLQTSIFSALSMAGITPNVLLVLTTMIGFMRGKTPGMVVGFISGILIDAFYPSIFGLNALLYMVIGLLNGFLRQVFYGDDVRFPMFLSGFSDFIYCGCVYFIAYFTRSRFDLKGYVLKITIPEMIYTMIVAVIMFYPIFRINEWIKGDDKRGARLV